MSELNLRALAQTWLGNTVSEDNKNLDTLLNRLRTAISSVNASGLITFAVSPAGIAAAPVGVHTHQNAGEGGTLDAGLALGAGTLAAARMPALTGDITTVAGAVATTIGASKVTNAMLAGSIAAAKLVLTDITTLTNLATVGTVTSGVWNAGAVTSSSGVTDSVGSLATVRAGGIGIAAQAALDFVYASSATQLARLAKGTGSQAIRLNAGATAYEFFTPGGTPAETFVGQANGTNTTAAATNVATVAISGLTARDSLHVIIRCSSLGAATALPVLYSVTDSVVLAEFSSLIPTGDYVAVEFVLSPDPTAATALVAIAHGGQSATMGGSIGTWAPDLFYRRTLTTAWTGSWTLALRTGAGGVTAGGTFAYDIRVYKVIGQ